MSHPNSKSKTSLATLFPFSMRDLIVTALILFVAVTFCILLQRLDPSAGFATPVFVLTVLLTSRLFHKIVHVSRHSSRESTSSCHSGVLLVFNGLIPALLIT